jgi:AsmA protein
VKLLKYALYGVAALAALAAIAVGAAVMIVDGAFVKSRLVAAMKEKNRALTIEGTPQLRLFPVAGIALGRTRLTEPGSDRAFVQLESAEVALRVMPLLSRVAALETFKVSGLKVNVVRAKDGRMNFADLAGERGEAPQEKGAPMQPRIAEVNIERAEIRYRDEASGRELTVGELNVKTGRLDGETPGKIEVSAHVRGRAPEIDVKARAEGGARFNLAKQQIGLDGFSAQAKGRIDRDTLAAELSAPKVDISPERASGAAVTGMVRVSGPQRNVDARLKIAAVEGNASALSIPGLTLDVAASLAGLAFKARAEGAVKADLEKQKMDAVLNAKLDDSAIRAKLELAKYVPLAAKFELAADRLDVDRYFPPKKGASDPNERIDLSALKGPTVTGKAEIGALTVRRVKLQNLKAEVRLNNGRLDLAPHSASLYGGSLSGDLSVDSSGNKISVKEDVKGVQIGPLLRDAAQQDRVEGRGNVSLDVTAEGASAAAMKKSLGGTGRVELRDGSVKGINLAESIQDVRSVLGSKAAKADDPSKRTDFSEITGSFRIKGGIARNDDLQGKAPLLRLGGAGDVDIGGSRVDYTARVSLVATSRGQGGRDLTQLVGVTVPVRLTGALEKPDVAIDFAEVIAKSGAGIGRALGSAGSAAGSAAGGIGDKIKGIFGR